MRLGSQKYQQKRTSEKIQTRANNDSDMLEMEAGKK
jgi:hypothetical protein